MSVYWKLTVCVGKHASAINSTAWIAFLFYTALWADDLIEVIVMTCPDAVNLPFEYFFLTH